MSEKCKECGRDLRPEITVVVADDFKVCKFCNDEVEDGWECTKEMLREQGIDPDNCGWVERLVPSPLGGEDEHDK